MRRQAANGKLLEGKSEEKIHSDLRALLGGSGTDNPSQGTEERAEDP